MQPIRNVENIRSFMNTNPRSHLTYEVSGLGLGCSSSTVEEHLPRHRKVEGSSSAAAAGSKNGRENGRNVKAFSAEKYAPRKLECLLLACLPRLI